MNEFEKYINESQFESAVKQFEESFHLLRKQMEIHSKIQKEYFNALIENGFTELQALEIVKAHGVDIGLSSHMKSDGGKIE